MGGGISKHVMDPTKDIVKLSERNLTELPFAITEDHPLRALNLSKNKIQRIPTRLNNLETLELSSNDLREPIEKNPGLELYYPKLVNLSLTNCNIEKLPEAINTLKTIKQFYADKNYLKSFDFDLPALETLSLMINYLTELPRIPPTILKLNVGFNLIRTLDVSLQNIVELRLAGNLINNISPNISFPHVKILDLSHNHIYELPPIDKLAPNVENLQLTTNFLVESPTGLPASLVKYDISYNMITHIKESFMHLTNLTHLDFSHNVIDVCPDIPPNVRSLSTEFNEFNSAVPLTNQNVRLLVLMNNKLQAIPDLSNSKVQTLCLNHNLVNTLDDVDNIPETVQQIELLSNKLNTISLEFIALKHLTILNLTNNQISHVPMEIAESNLKALIIGENPLTRLPRLPQTLQALSCNSCQFTEFPDTIYTLSKLKHVDFSCNNISVITTIPSVFINLNNNQITQLPVIYKHTQTLLIAHNKLKVAKLIGKQLCNVDVSHNEIKEFQIAPSNEIRVLKLSHNPAKYEINVAFFPNLDSIDIVGTKVKLVNLEAGKKIQEIVQDDPQVLEARDATRKCFQCAKTVGYYEYIGIRPTMEDALIIRQLTNDIRLIAVLDGHAGNKTAIVGALYMPELFLKNSAYDVKDIPPIIADLNNKLQQMQVKDGATLALAVVKKDDINIAHLGDARVVLVRKDGSVLELTVDHKATDRMEYDLLKEKRCFLQSGRVNGMLAVSRTIGDFDLTGVLRTPATTVHHMTEDDYRLIIACDGIWDVISSSEAGRICMLEEDCHRAASRLVSTAFSRGSQDNMSAVVVNLVEKKGLFKKKK